MLDERQRMPDVQPESRCCRLGHQRGIGL